MPIKETFDSPKHKMNMKIKDAKKNAPKDEDDAEVINKGGKKDVYEIKSPGEIDDELEGRAERRRIEKSDSPEWADSVDKKKKPVNELMKQNKACKVCGEKRTLDREGICHECWQDNKDITERKRPIFEKYQAIHESKTSEQISRSLGYLLSIAGNAKTLHAGIKASEPMLNEKLVKKLAAVLHVISKIKSGNAPNEAPAKSEKSDTEDTKDKGDK